MRITPILMLILRGILNIYSNTNNTISSKGNTCYSVSSSGRRMIAFSLKLLEIVFLFLHFTCKRTLMKYAILQENMFILADAERILIFCTRKFDPHNFHAHAAATVEGKTTGKIPVTVHFAKHYLRNIKHNQFTTFLKAE